MVTWEPWQWGGNGANQPDYSLANITSGRHDDYIRTFARSVKQVNGIVYMRIMHEMNGDWYPWAGTVNGNRPEQFIPAYRHIVDIFRQEGATNTRWVWSPNYIGLPYWDASSFSWYFPGDAYVDFGAIDGYNFGTTQSWSEWTDFRGVFDAAYREVAALTAKPIIIAETASAEAGGSKADWITDAFARLAADYPRITALIWFNENKEADWRVESSPESLAAYRAAMAGLGETADAQPPEVDTLAPTGSVTINGGADYTRSRQVTLNLSANDGTGSGVAYMRFSNDGVFDDTTGAERWLAYAGTASWSLRPGNGTKIVYAQFKDRSGNVSASVSDTIILQTGKRR